MRFSTLAVLIIALMPLAAHGQGNLTDVTMQAVHDAPGDVLSSISTIDVSPLHEYRAEFYELTGFWLWVPGFGNPQFVVTGAELLDVRDWKPHTESMVIGLNDHTQFTEPARYLRTIVKTRNWLTGNQAILGTVTEWVETDYGF